MNTKKKIMLMGLLLIVGILNFMIFTRTPSLKGEAIVFGITLKASQETDIDLFYADSTDLSERSFSEEKKVKMNLTKINEWETLSFVIPADITYIRLDIGAIDNISDLQIQKIEELYKKDGEFVVKEWSEKRKNQIIKQNMIEIGQQDQLLTLSPSGADPYLVWDMQKDSIIEIMKNEKRTITNVINILVCLILNIGFLGLLRFQNKFLSLPIELYNNRALIWKLSTNDFKTKFAGSYLGIVWAFIQPVVTVLVYWFVFQVGLRNGSVGEVPFVLWLISGLVPWFFFQDALNGGTSALLEYNYLVKKVVFKVSILPIVKIISAMFIHVCFIGFSLILFGCYGHFPGVYGLQIIYYTFCIFMLVLGISYATSAIVIFFRDLTQIINIVLQVGTWMTPILWDVGIIPEKYLWIFKLNPMYYIVSGYRDALIDNVWFWDKFEWTAYFWIVTAACFMLGTVIFKRLKVHFADVL